MAWFKKKDKVIDLGKKYKEQQAAQRQARQLQNSQDVQTSNQATSSTSSTPTQTGGGAGFGIFDSDSSANQTQTSSDSDFVNLSDTVDGRRQRLAKRILEMTSKMENLSNQVYHLQQRIEVLERKLNVGRY